MKLDDIETGEAMSGRENASSTSHFLDAVTILGGPGPAMLGMGLSKTEFAELIAGGAVVGTELAENIELLTGGRVSKKSLRPDVWNDASTFGDVAVSGLTHAELEFIDAFEAYRQAFRDAERNPRVATFRACVEACDAMMQVASRK